MKYQDFLGEILKIKKARERADKLFQMRMERLSIPIVELKKYYTVTLWYGLGYTSELNFRTKNDALNHMRSKLKELRGEDYFNTIAKFTLSVTVNGVSDAVSTQYDIVAW